MAPILEVRTGAPSWYGLATLGLFLATQAALFVTPLRTPYAAGVFAWSVAVMARCWWQQRGRAPYLRLRIHDGRDLVLLDAAGQESAVERGRGTWVSSRLVVFPVRLPTGAVIRLLVSRERNSRDAFRRFKVLCRFRFAANDAERHNGSQFTTTGA